MIRMRDPQVRMRLDPDTSTIAGPIRERGSDQQCSLKEGHN
jgi:hypothetical protein